MENQEPVISSDRFHNPFTKDIVSTLTTGIS